jgi:nitrous oxide reductase accessory protein NosL
MKPRQHEEAHGHAPHEPCKHDAHTGELSRRRLCTVLAAGAATALAGCSGGGGSNGGQTTGDVPAAVTLTTDDACEVCGMIIPNHPGPTTEIFYPGREPSGHENPARFDSTWEAFQYDFDRQDEGWERAVMYVTDYSAVDYDVFEESGDKLISTHPQAESFTTAAEVTFVAGSEVKGAMGRDLIAFSAAADAESFEGEYGGERVTVDEVTPELIAQLGM